MQRFLKIRLFEQGQPDGAATNAGGLPIVTTAARKSAAMKPVGWTAYWAMLLVLMASLLFGFEVAQARGNRYQSEDSWLGNSSQLETIAAQALPAEARETLSLIKQGGPYPFEKDGTVFSNREKILPKKPRGYYHEYTVITPRSRDRGARRIIAGGVPATSGEYYYTEDHYTSFKKIQE